MLFVEIFYSVCWVSMVSVLWFYTDFVLHYGQLLGFGIETRLDYLNFLIENPTKYFPDYLYEKSLECDDFILKFIYKLVSCPFCLTVWLSLLGAACVGNLIVMAPIYVGSILTILQIKKMI